MEIKWQINTQLFPYLTPQDLNFLVSEMRKGMGGTIKDIPRRTVKKIELNGRGFFFVKHIKIIGLDTTLKYFILYKKIFTEWRLMNQAIQLEVPTAYPVAFGIHRKLGFLKEAFLITKSLGETITLHQFYKENIKTEFEKDQFINNLAHYLQFLHQKGILHHDIHIENIVIPAEKSHPFSFYLIDLYKARVKKNPSERNKMLNLAQLLFSAAEQKLFDQKDIEKFIRFYYLEDSISEKKLCVLMEKIFSTIAKLTEVRFRNWGGKSFKPGKFFNIYKGKGKFLIHRWEFKPEVITDILELHEKSTNPIRGIVHPDPDNLPPAILKTSRKSIVTKISLNGETFCVKEGRNDHGKPSLRFSLARSRNRKSWTNSHKLLLKEIPTPRCLALQEEKRSGFWVQSFLIMEYIKDYLPLNNYIKKVFQKPSSSELFRRKIAFIAFIAKFFRTLHQKGIYHGDLKSDNFLIKEKGDKEWECFIVDIDRVVFGKEVSLYRRIKNLSQLNATIAQCISPSNRIKFFQEYDDTNNWDRRERKKIYRQILNLCQSRKTEAYGVSFMKKKFFPDRPLKILHVNTESTWRGGEQQVLYLIEGLNKRGYVSHLLCQSNGSMYSRALQKNITTFPLRMRGEIDLFAALKIARKISQEKYDIIHSHTSHAHSLIMWASYFLKKKPIRLITRRVDFSIFRHNFLGMNIYKYTKGVDHLIAISHDVKDVLIKDGVPSEKISVVHSGADMNRFQGLKGDHILREFSLSSHVPILGNVGYLVGHKGQEYLIQAMVQVVQKFPEAHLVIIGKGKLEKELKAFASELGLNQNITFTGFRDDVGAFMNIFDVLVISSTGEGLGTTILDALALEVPIVSTDTGGIPEIITNGETGILVPPADSEALASGIIWALSNYNKAKAMAKKGKLMVREKFSAEAMVEGNIQVYQRLIAERRSNSCLSQRK